MFKTLISVIAIALLVGCASPATQQSMSVTAQDIPTKVNAKLKGQLAVRTIGGGKETNPMWISQVDGQGFKGALDKSLAVAGYKAVDGSAAKYSVDANLQDLDQPFMGFTFDVVSTVLYTVTGEGQQKQFPITATGSASTSDAFIGMERMRIANERSIKENIKQFLLKLGDQAGW
ncbi:MAG TPA: hypothetical protein PLC97_11120 [Myxococcota bacterium]|nr:hypothetical protein [Myxococcota bacterium]